VFVERVSRPGIVVIVIVDETRRSQMWCVSVMGAQQDRCWVGRMQRRKSRRDRTISLTGRSIALEGMSRGPIGCMLSCFKMSQY